MLTHNLKASVATFLVALCCPGLVQGPYFKEVQVFRSWAEVGLLSSWTDTSLQVVVPGSTTSASGATRVEAKTISIRAGIEGFSIVLVSDPATRDTCFLRAAPIVVSTQTGMYAMQLTLSNLNVWRSYFCAPKTASQDEALASFVSEFGEERVAGFSKTAGLRLGLSAPPKFFVNGSQLVSADIQTVDLQDGALRVRMKNYAGLVGTFWVDTRAWTVTKADFAGR